MAEPRKTFSRLIEKHATSKWGMSNEFLESLCFEICPEFFSGVFSVNEAGGETLGKIRRRNSSTVIFNVGGHFVLTCVTPEFVMYVDPFGLPPLSESLREKFLNPLKKSRYFCWNSKPVQSLKSKHCGLYCALFCLFFEKFLTHPDDPSKLPSLSFVKDRLERNDRRCVKFFEMLL